jgi:hypothetical protein
MSTAPSTPCMGTDGAAGEAPRQASRALEAALAAVPLTDLASAKVRGLMRGYDARWSAVQSLFRVLSVEETLEGPLWNPETGRNSRTFTVAGKLDVRAETSGQSVFIDHKTTSEDIDDPCAPYWRQLVIEGQASHYMLLEWLNGRKVDGAIWDVVRKPGIEPRKLTSQQMQQTYHHGRYFGHEISLDELQMDGRESLAMYEARLAHDCTVERPERYFQRRYVQRLDAEIYEYAGELWGHGDEIRRSRVEDKHPRNSGACMNYGRPCEFLGICSGHSDIENWGRKQNVHAELPYLDKSVRSRDVLTNSRIRSFQTCRRKHHYDYNLGLVRIEEVEALYFGNLWHKAQEAWWGSFIQQEVA